MIFCKQFEGFQKVDFRGSCVMENHGSGCDVMVFVTRARERVHVRQQFLHVREEDARSIGFRNVVIADCLKESFDGSLI